jgi:hypothetical protein
MRCRCRHVPGSGLCSRAVCFTMYSHHLGHRGATCNLTSQGSRGFAADHADTGINDMLTVRPFI